jgi:serine/threonine protein kinase
MFVCPECGAALPAAGACPSDGTALVHRGEDLLIGMSVGAYRVARLLGVGGMGRVYKGVHPQIGSRVAIKVLSRECADRKDLVDRFFSEARAVNLIRHESIVNVLDLATLPDGRPYIVMEYLDGAPLSEIITRMGGLPLGGLTRLTTEVLDALGAAHAKGIVHRDLKPDNIYVTPAGRPKVLDFGIAKLLPELGGSFTQSGSLLGTPHYMAPEQALGKPVDHRTDVYSLGVILYECATGRRPFNADSLFDLLRKHVDEAPVPPRHLRPDLPPPMEAVILTAMAKDPNARFASAMMMAQALMQSAQTLPTQSWVAVSPATAGIVVPGLPSGPGYGSGGGSGAGWSPSPMPLSPMPPTPQPPTPHPQLNAGMAGMRAHWDAQGTQPMNQQPPHGHHHPPTEPQRTPTTATAGQVVKSPPSGKRGALFAVLALVLIGGGVVAGVLLTRKDKTTGPVATGSGSGSGSAGPIQIAEADDPPEEPDDPPDEPDDPPDDPPTKAKTPATKPDDPPSTSPTKTDPATKPMFDADQLEMMKKMPAAQKKQLLDQIREARKQMEDNLVNIPPNSRGDILRILEEYKKVEAALGGAPDPSLGASGTGGGGQVAVAPQPTDAIENRDLPKPSGFNAKKFDVTGYAKTALEWARKNVDPDAKLFRIDADGVTPDGMADLTIDDDYMVDYRFISPARSKRPDSLPLGVKYEWDCMFRIWVQREGIQIRNMKGWDCKEKTLALPKCSAKQVWKTAVDKGAPDKNAVGELGYRAGMNDKPTWYFSIDDVFSEMWLDDC